MASTKDSYFEIEILVSESQFIFEWLLVIFW